MYESTGRKPLTLAIVLGIWAVLGALVWGISLSPVIAAGLGLFTLPALLDWIRSRPSRLGVGAAGIDWVSGRASGTVHAENIAHLRIDRRMDMGYRLSIVDRNGRAHRLPPDLAPPVATLTEALESAGIDYQMNPFSLIPR